jgi:flagellar hook-associated protein 1 FlgK
VANNIYNSIQKASSGLSASQAGLNVTGQNISNVNTEGYSRQRVELKSEALTGNSMGYMGLGVSTEGAKRIYDDIIAKNLRGEKSLLEYYNNIETTLKSSEVYFNELEIGGGLGQALEDYFNAWSDLANTAPDDSAESQSKKEVVISTATVLTTQLNEASSGLSNERYDSNKRIAMYVDEINNMAKEISTLNKDIISTESNGRVANELRDRRDLLLNNMSELVDINTYENEDGAVSVFIGNNALVDGVVLNKLYLIEDKTNSNFYNIYWGNNQNGPSLDITNNINAGKLKAELDLRDQYLKSYLDRLNTLSENLIFETNKLHSKGYGESFFTNLTSNNGVSSRDLELSKDRTMSNKINEGQIVFSIFDINGEFVGNRAIKVDPTKNSLSEIVEGINKDEKLPLKAGITGDNKLQIFTKEGYSFAIADDTTNLLASLQLNTFFDGTNSEDIKINNLIEQNTQYLASHSILTKGDNTLARNIAHLKLTNIESLDNSTFEGYYTSLSTKVASDLSKTTSLKSTKEYSVNQLKLKLDEVAGVSLEEEFVNMIKFQKAYEANARMITTLDQMLDTIINNMGIVGR